MNQKVLKLVCLNILIALSICPTVQAKTPETKDPIFVFHTDEFWLNLHHFLYVLGRADNKERDTARDSVAGAPADQESGLAKLSAKEQEIWREAVAAYASGASKKDIVFDDPMPAVTAALARAGEAKSLGSEIDPEIAKVLQRAAPIYRKAWWKQHREANRNWQKAVDVLIDRHGATVLALITRAYMLQWPAAGFPVHVSAYTNWAGAYSTTGNLLVLASQSPSLQGVYGLETIFHEGMHQWDDQVFAAMREQAIKLNKFFPRGLTHSLIFFTAGEAVRRAVEGGSKGASTGVGSDRTGPSQPAYVPYAENFGVWQRGMGPFKIALEEIWKPYLDGRGTREQAFAALIERTAIDPPKSNPPER